MALSSHVMVTGDLLFSVTVAVTVSALSMGPYVGILVARLAPNIGGARDQH